MVFRDPLDNGESRLMTTPAPSILISQLNSFIQKWDQVEYKGWKVLSSSALLEASKLTQHMLKGCLTGIKPGRGTNRNEALHKKLNKIVASSRYGVELAYALFSTIFFQHNERIAATAENRRIKVITEFEYLKTHQSSDEYFGIHWLDHSSDHVAAISPLTLQRSSYSNFVSRITGSDTAQSVAKRQEINLESEEKYSQQDEHFSDDDDFILPLGALKLILLKALSWYFAHEHMSQQTRRAKIPLKELPFMNSALPKLLNSTGLDTIEKVGSLSDSTNRGHADVHAQRLDAVLESWNVKRVRVLGDGNCLFYAVSHALLHKNNYSLMAEKLGFPVLITHKELARLLRQALVSEWLGDNSIHYQSFLTHDQLQVEAQRFLHDGEFNGDLGDLILPALVNILSMPITIFTSAENMPVITVTPISSLVIDTNPLFLAYNQSGAGHYDAVAPFDHMQDKENVSRTAKCSCEKNSTKGVSCVYSIYHYSTKCPCFKAERSCNSDCRCRGCQNPHGARPINPPKTGQKRKRDQYVTQVYSLKGKKTAVVADQTSDEVSVGSLSSLEYLLICAIVQHAYVNLVDWTDAETIDPDFIFKNFDAIQNITKALNLQLPLFKRNVDDIQKALKHYRSVFNVFYKLHT